MWDMCEVERRNVKRNVLWQNQKPTLVTVNFINISNNYEPLQTYSLVKQEKRQIQYDITYT